MEVVVEDVEGVDDDCDGEVQTGEREVLAG